MISFARVLILDLALLSIFPNTQHLGCVSIWFHLELFEKLCSRNEASPLLERQLDERCPPLFLQELFHSPEQTEKPIDFSVITTRVSLNSSVKPLLSTALINKA